MGYTVTERNDGRRPAGGDRPSNQIPYLIRGDTAEDDVENLALAAMVAESPATLDGMVRTGWEIEERLTDSWFTGRVSYGSDSTNKETGESSYSFDTTGGTFHITQSRSTVGSYAASGSPPSFQGAINATADGVEGVDITVPQYAFSETHYLPADDVTDTYKGVLYALTGKVCNATFKGCEQWECLFLGARGGQRARGDWELTFLFAASPNVTGLQIGSITGINKAGWDYLWVYYEVEPVGTGANKILVPRPKFVYVEEVYDEANLALLGIGT